MSNNVSERFAKDVEHHEMTVLREDGLYRHLRFTRVTLNEKTAKRERSSAYWFDLVTWPNCLVINGDMGSFMFARLDDMFEFFRGFRINPQYWAEKVRGETKVSSYSEERFRQHVTDVLREAEPVWPGLTEAAERDIFGHLSDWNTEYEDGARQALEDFTFGETALVRCTCGERAGDLTPDGAVSWRGDHRAAKATIGHQVTIYPVEGFRFTDTWEWDLNDWDWRFLWCCHAIQWGIRRYDDSTVSADDTVAVAGGVL